MENIDLYKTAVMALAATGNNLRFSNKGSSHAEVVVEQILMLAKHKVVWFSGCVSSDFLLTDSIRTAIRNFLTRESTELYILTEKEIDPGAKEFLDALTGHIFIKKLNPAFKNAKTQHFMVADGIALRIETNDSTREAIVNFNEPETAALLMDWFDISFVNS